MSIIKINLTVPDHINYNIFQKRQVIAFYSKTLSKSFLGLYKIAK